MSMLNDPDDYYSYDGNVRVDANTFLNDVTLVVTVHQSISSKIRMRAMIGLIRLAVWVGGLGGVEVVENA